MSSAGFIDPGVYQLSNHPRSDVGPPGYGLRLDELFNATPGHDIFTLDFDAPGSAVTMTVTTSSIRIAGRAIGGRDTGNGYASDSHLGIYTFDITYSRGVAPVPGDDDVWVNTTNRANTGFLRTPIGDVKHIVDERADGYSLRLGNETDDHGHRGHRGISGWGGITHGGPPYNYNPVSGWLFTARYVPAPAWFAVAGSAALVLGRRRRS